MGRKFLISFVVMFVMTVASGIIVHGFLLGGDYAAMQQLYRQPGDMSYMPYLYLGQALFAAAFVWIYQKGREDKPFLMQGIRYGVAVAVLATIPTYLIYYAVQPLPAVMVLKQIVFSTIGVVISGIVLAWLNK